jgi:PAP2 superfamily
MKYFKHLRTLLLACITTAVFFQSCRNDEAPPYVQTQTNSFDNKVYKAWNDKYLELDRYAKGNRPGTGPRSLAYMSLAAYESVVAGMPENNSLELQYSGISLPKIENGQEYYWPACVNESYGFLMTRFFSQMEIEYPALFNGIDQLHNQLHEQYAGQTTPEILARSENYGKLVATAIYEWEKQDFAGHNAFLNAQPNDYQPPFGPGLWQPTWSDFSAAVFPYWGDVRCFAMRASDLIAKPPIPFSEEEGSPFYAQAYETFSAVNNITKGGPGAYESKWAAEFWSDDMVDLTFGPPTHLYAIANQVMVIENLNLAQCAELYAKLAMAMSDAGVAVWKSKYIYNVERPITYIRRVMAQKYPEATHWKTMLNNPITGVQGFTPAFPAYPSGHSGFGGAGAKILASFFEYTQSHAGTYSFTDLCHNNRVEFIGTPRTFSSFKALGDEDAYSRIPLGVHFRMDCDEGVRMGELAAQRVLELPWRK